ncbi:hypothetical protein [Desulfospira joergensenii]|uniref:hypothetical protein n=1 Tax=Desulfospira joergensenii TaxID=53329 RepID=UPI0012946741|nr:hypothetical protein [Desulfospira joergensenii]
MGYALKKRGKECIERHRAFWENDSIGVPLVFAIAENPEFIPKPWVSQKTRKEWDLFPDWHVNRVNNYLNGTCFLADAIPVASLTVGLDITNTAVLAGGDYDYSSTQNFIDFKSGGFKLDNPIPLFTPNNALVKDLECCYDKVIHTVKDRAMVNTPTTLDALSSIYGMCGSKTLLTDLVCKKKLIKKRVEEMTEVYLQFYDYFYAYLKEKGYGESASWFQVFAEGKFESVRCDFSVMISEDMFKEFVIPELVQVCDHMDYSMFNMCSVKHARFVDALADIQSLTGIFWNPEPYIEGVKDYLHVLKKIKKRGLCLEVVCHSVEDAVIVARELGPDGLYVFFEKKFNTCVQAQEAIDKVYGACR